jgi:hypothetical protein
MLKFVPARAQGATKELRGFAAIEMMEYWKLNHTKIFIGQRRVNEEN